MLGHIILAILVQVCVFFLLRNWWSGAAAASGWAISREITQAEYRWIELNGGGLRANMPWWGGLDYRVWQRLEPWLDWLVPCAVTVAVALLASRVSRQHVHPGVR